MNRFSHNRHRRDATHHEIAGVLLELGCSVLDISQCGVEGAPDLAVGLCGRDYKVECKSRGEALRQAQRLWHEDWRGERPVTLWTRDQAVAWVNAMRARARRAA